jgi:hypothetical protein
MAMTIFMRWFPYFYVCRRPEPAILGAARQELPVAVGLGDSSRVPNW